MSSFAIDRKNKYFHRITSTFIILVLFLGSFVVLTPQSASAIGSSALISLTNQQRAAAGVPALQYNGRLSSSAYMKAQDMIAKNYWSHVSPDGLTAWTFIRRAGYAYTSAGENLAQGYSSDSAVISGWMNSPTHRANLLSRAYRDVGIAVVVGNLLGRTTTLVVAHYGATSAVAPAPAPAPAPTPTTVTRRTAPVRTQPGTRTVTRAVSQSTKKLTPPQVQAAATPPGPKPAPRPDNPSNPDNPNFGELLWRMLNTGQDSIPPVTLESS